MSLSFTPGSVLKLLACIIGLLLVGNIVSYWFLLFTVHDHAGGLVPLLSFDRENGLPAFYSATMLLISGLLALTIANRHRLEGTRSLAWFVLGALFVFLSVDELAAIHERLMGPMRAAFDTEGVFHWPWVIPYGIAVIILGVLYIPFLTRLPRRTMWLFLISGGIFVGGAIGMEMVGGQYVEVHGVRNVVYAAIATTEELMEKIGVALFIYALLDYFLRQFGPVSVHLSVPLDRPAAVAVSRGVAPAGGL